MECMAICHHLFYFYFVIPFSYILFDFSVLEVGNYYSFSPDTQVAINGDM